MDPPAAPDHSGEAQSKGSDQGSSRRRESFTSQDSQTAEEFIDSQLKLEADAREVLPYSFDSCTQPLGPLRQSLFSCLTCNPPPANPDEPYTAAGVCYSCSIACHGEHTLVELFTKRNFVCDCGTTRLQSTSPCTLRTDPETGRKGVHSQKPAEGNKYNHNFRNRFCGCNEEYDPHKEKGTMFQCLGLGTVETGGCGEDWWHPECLIGLPRGWQKAAKSDATVKEGENGTTASDVKPEEEGEEEEEEESLPPGFPGEDDFETFICYKCLDSNPWLKRYANTPGFLPPVYKDGGLQGPKGEVTLKSSEEKKEEQTAESRKRKAEDDAEDEQRDSKRTKGDELSEDGKVKEEAAISTPPKHKHESLPSNPPTGTFSLFVKEDFREHLCHCPDCFPNLIPHPQLREEEETYEPPLSEDGDGANGGGSQGTGSLLERGEAALSNIDRVRAIEGVMVYNHLRDKVKEFLKPFAESGQPVSAEDIKAYFEKLRGDDLAIKEAGGQASAFGGGSDDTDGEGGNRKEQSGY
ncbi:hypothetical protein VTN77DRAFT_7262 [Rasamsonia byssochlamydoides]|uniref:uncharacterized protein n=1 Tax=Rasamsonia byssochlamydoides TaxID=89139 RepID=UPI003743AFC9